MTKLSKKLSFHKILRIWEGAEGGGGDGAGFLRNKVEAKSHLKAKIYIACVQD